MKKLTAVQITSPFLAAFALLLVPSAEAASYTFVGNDAAGSGEYDWNDATNWVPSTNYPNAVGAVANVTSTDFAAATGNNGFQGPLTLDLNIAITVGVLNLGDSVNGNAILIEKNAGNAGNTASLTLNNGGAGAVFTDVGTGDMITAPVFFNDTKSNTIVNSFTAGGNTLTLSGGVGGTGKLIIQNNAASSVRITSAGTLTGTTTVNGGTLNLSGTTTTQGTLGSSVITVNGGTLAINTNGATNAPASVTRAGGVTLNGSTLTDTGNGIANTHDVINGALTFNSGTNVVTLAAGTKSVELSASSLSSGTGSYALVNGTNLGSAAVGTAGGSNILFTTAPATVGTTTGSGLTGADTTKNLVIVPNLVGEVSTTAGGTGTQTGTANTFLTYDSQFGLRPLDLTNEYTLNALTAGNNVQLTTGTTSGTTTSVNSLLINGPAGGNLTITDGTTLTVASGAIMFLNGDSGGDNSRSIAPSSSTGTLNFGTATANITTAPGYHSNYPNGNSVLTISAVMAGSGGLVKEGTGQLSLTGANTYTGSTSVLNGVLSYNHDNNFGGGTDALLLGDTTGNNSVTVVNNYTANNDSNDITRNIIVQGGNTGTVTIHSGGASFTTVDLNGTVTLGSNGVGHSISFVDDGYRRMFVNGTIQDPVGLTGTPGSVSYETDGNVGVTGNNTYTGNTYINGGYELDVDSNTAFGTGTIIIGGDQLSGTATLANKQIWNGDFGLVYSQLGAGSANLTATGAIAINGNRTLYGNGFTYNLLGVISDGASGPNDALTLNNLNSTVSGANTFTGGLTLAGGNLTIGNLGVNATASALGTGTFTVSQATFYSSASGTLATNNAEVWNGDFTYGSNNRLNMGNGAVSLGTATDAARTVTVSNGGGTFETDGAISNGTNSTPTTGLTKAGSGTLVLGGASTYTGVTTVNAGTLTLDSLGTTTARLGGTSSIVLNTGGTLLLANSGGTASADRINNAAGVTMSGGMLSLGGFSEGAAGASGVGLLTLTATSTLNFGPMGTSNLIQFAGLGTHTQGGGVLTITNWEGSPGIANGTDRLLFAGTSGSFVSEYAQKDVSFDGVSGYNVTQFNGYYEVEEFSATVPEPSTWVGCGVLLAIAGWISRKRLVTAKDGSYQG